MAGRHKKRCRTLSTHKKKSAAKRAAKPHQGARVVGKRGHYRVMKCGG